jgi:hypothetical protein
VLLLLSLVNRLVALDTLGGTRTELSAHLFVKIWGNDINVLVRLGTQLVKDYLLLSSLGMRGKVSSEGRRLNSSWSPVQRKYYCSKLLLQRSKSVLY